MINGLRFIIGSGCNYNCFFCHHEGYEKINCNTYDINKLKAICKFASDQGIKDISITGGEPFLYWNKLYDLLTLFKGDNFKITLNTNLVLAHKYIDYLKTFNNIEYHINFSSLNADIHKKIIEKEYLQQLKNNLFMLKENNMNVCLNVPVLKNMNTDELIDILNYSKQMNFLPRYLVLLPMNDEHKKYFYDVEDIIKEIPKSTLVKKYSYGRYDINSDLGNYEIVKCLCVDHECELCRKTTYIHLTPDLNMRLCMESKIEYKIDFTNDETVKESFQSVARRLTK